MGERSWPSRRRTEQSRNRESSASGSPFGRNVSNWVGRDLANPTNVLHFATEYGFVGHSAALPEELLEFFIKLFTRQGDVVCDPFMGSGTTGVVCKCLNRSSIGIDILEKNVRLAETACDGREVGCSRRLAESQRSGGSFVRGDEIDWAAAVGLGGQRIYIIPTT